MVVLLVNKGANYSLDQFMCKDGTFVSNSVKCIMDRDPYGEPSGCRDASHLQDCGMDVKMTHIYNILLLMHYTLLV